MNANIDLTTQEFEYDPSEEVYNGFNRTEVVKEILRKDTPLLEWKEGDNLIRPIKTDKQWFISVPYYEVRAFNKVARICRPEIFGIPNIIVNVQVALYRDPSTRPLMRTKENPNGFHFREKMRAYFVAARYENRLGPFQIAYVTLGKNGKDKYREAWGDAFLKLPYEQFVDVTTNKSVPRWGSIYDPVDGRIIKITFSNIKTRDIAVRYTPADQTFPLGEFVNNGQVVTQRPLPPNTRFRPFREYIAYFVNQPKVMNFLEKTSEEEQIAIIREFTPPHLKTAVEGIIQNITKKPVSGVINSSVPVPAPEPMPPAKDITYTSFVQALGNKFNNLGSDTVKKLIERGIVNGNNFGIMAEMDPDTLKRLAQ